jgi:cytoskeletal protein RodZ
MNELYLKLGQLLKLERERRKLQLATISEELKISEENLRHIEAGAYERLPGDLYFNLFE